MGIAEVRVASVFAGCTTLFDQRIYDVPRQDFSAMYIADDAPIEIAVGSRDYVALTAGDVFCIPRGDAHSVRLPGALRLFPAELQPPFREGRRELGRCATVFAARVPTVANPLPDLVPQSFLLSRAEVEEHGQLDKVLYIVRQIALSGDDTSAPIMNRLAEIVAMMLLQIILEWHRKDGLNAAGGVSDPRLRKALLVIHNRPSESWTLAELANVAGFSRSVFAERFHAAVGQTPMQYLTQVRINNAIRLLMQQNLSIAEIAWRSGYHSDAAFNKAFRRIIGSSPTDYRRTVV